MENSTGKNLYCYEHGYEGTIL